MTMAASAPVPREQPTPRYCATCGRPCTGDSRTDCGGCTGLFALGTGHVLYSPATGRPLLQSAADGKLIRPGHSARPRAPIGIPRLHPQAKSLERDPGWWLFWWGLAVAALVAFLALLSS